MLEQSVFPRVPSSFRLPYFRQDNHWIKRIVTPGVCLAVALTCAFVAAPSRAQGAAHLTSAETASGGASTASARGDFSSIAVGSKSTAQTFTFTFDKVATIGTPQVLTEGMSEMDFADTTSGSCDTNGTSHVYQPGDTCTLTVLFTPKYAGARNGAVKLADSSNNVLAIAYIHGVGTGGVKPSATGVQDVLAHTAPQGFALDGAGNLYVADIVTGAVHLYGTRGGHYWQINDVAAAGSLQQPYGVAVDGGGNVYVSDATLNVVRKYVPVGASYSQGNDVASGLYQPQGIAVDGSGDVYVVEAGNHDVRKYAPNSDGSYTRAQDVTSSGLQQPNGVAIDSKGSVYVSDAGVGAVLRYASNSDGSYTQLANVADGSTLHQPYGVAIDGHGDVFIADAPNNQVHEYAPSVTGGYNKLSDVGQGLNSPHGVALDGNGNVYIANTGSGQVVKDHFASLGRFTPDAAFNWNACVTPSPVIFSSATDQPTAIEVGGGANTDSDGNTCDLYDLGLYPTNTEEINSFQDFNTTTLHNVGIIFHFLSCNFVTSGGPGSGGCLPNGAPSLNTYYGLQLATTTETSDSVTVYMDPTSSGTPTQAIVIPLTINAAVSTSTSVSSSLNPATLSQSETFTATVTSSSTVNAGTVSFSSNSSVISGCTALPVSNGVATCYTVLLTGNYSIVANYSGASGFASSTSTTALTQVVNPLVTATIAIASKALTQNHAATSFTPITGGGGTPSLAYSIAPTLPAGLSMSPTTGAITGNPTVTSPVTIYIVTVTDANSQVASNTFSLKVNSVVTATQSVAAKILTQNFANPSFTPVTGGGGTTPLAYSVSPTLPAGLSMSSSTGAISGTPSSNSGPVTYTVSVTDANGATASNTFQMAINTPVLATQSIPSKVLTQNRAATSFIPVTGAGGVAPLVYSVSLTLPTGLSISSSTGAITGIPSATSAATTYTVTATDSNGATGSNTFALTVNAAVSATQSIATETLTQSHATSFTPVTSSGGTSPLTYAISPALPMGLSITSSTGVISGTPSVTSAATTYTVTITDQNGSTASNTFVLTINSAVTATQSVASDALTQNHAATSFTPVMGGSGTGTLAYSISPTLPTGLSISSSTGTISGTPSATLAATTFTVTVTDANSATATATFSLTVNPAVTATQSIASKGLTQNQVATSFTPVTGGGGTGALAYAISPTLPTGLSISSSTGAITGTATGVSSATTYTVTVTDQNSATAANTFSLTVNALPTATQSVATKTLTQNHATTSFIPVTGSGGTPSLSYSISPALPTGLSISSTTGAITGTPNATSTATTYTVTVTDANSATATATFSLTVSSAVTATQAVAVTVLTQNHAAVSFTPVTGASGTGTLAYSVSPSMPSGLSLSTSTGAVSGTPAGTSAATSYTVTVTDANSATATATFSLTVNAAVTATVEVSAVFLTKSFAVTPFTPVLGGGGTAPLSYSISPALPSGMSISSSSGVVSGTSSVTSTATTYTVTVTDANGETAAKSFAITINGPVSATTVIASIGLTVNNSVTSLTPVTGSGGTGTLQYSVSPTLPAGIAMSPTTGTISGLPTNTTSATTYTVTVTDANSATATAMFSIAINGAVTASTAIASKVLTQNSSASFTPVNGGGGTTPLRYSVSPALPAGLAINSASGVVSGNPTLTSAATSYTVTATDANNSTANANFSLTVNPAVSAAQAVTSAVLTQNHAATSFTPVAGSGGTGTLSYSVSPVLPAGLNFSSSTGAISGTPTVALAATTFTITVTDQNSATASNTFSLTVNAAVTATQSIATVVLTQNHATTSFMPVAGSGGTGTLTYSVSPTLPAGLIFSSSTGTITGAPTVSSPATSYTVTVTDANGATATANFSLSVNSAVTAAQAVASTMLTQNHAVTSFVPVTGGGGTGTLSYSVTPTLPSGLNYSSSTGAITGTPTAASVATTYTVTVTDHNNATATATFSLAVDAAVVATQSIASTTLTQNHAVTSFAPVTGSGGDGTLTYSVSPALPAGLSFNASTGAVSGTPTAPSVATTYTVTVSDTNNATATATFSLTVNAAVTATVAIASEALTYNTPASFTPITGTGGTGALSYSISPALPAGLSLSLSTGAISGTTSVITTATTYTVTVTDTNNATASASFSLAVNKAASSVALAASTSNITPVQQVTLTATLTDGTSGSTGTPSGQVSFFDGSTLLTTVTASGGVASYSTTLSPGATHAITATYAGDGNFQAGSTLAAVSVTVASLDFTLTPISLPQPLYVVPGRSVSFTFNVTPQYGSFPGTVIFTLTGPPNGATYSFSPASLPASSTGGVITGTINVPVTIAASHTGSGKYAPMIAALLLLPFLGMKRSRKKMGMLVLLLLAGGALSMMTGCGGPGDGLLQQKSESIQVTLTITSGTISHSVPFTLIVE